MEPLTAPAPAATAPNFQRLHNFSAGPGALPDEVMLEVREELPAYPGLGASIMEVSHRSKEFDAIWDRARSRMKALLGMGDEWDVLFVQGGASMMFYQVPLNFLRADASADYFDTGTWANKAIKEAKRCGNVNVAASSKTDAYTYIPEPDTWQLDENAAYLHFTSNNTVYGTQFHAEPEANVPLVCDASSDFLSRPIDVSRYGLIYAGAQKNIGPAGVTAVLIRDDFMATKRSDLPTMLDFGTHAKGEMFNTPPVFAVYIVDKVLAWLERNGGVEAMVTRNDEKAALLYGAIDATDFYRGTVQSASRSKMNVTYRLPSEELEERFVKEAKAEGLLALKGHRSVGGIRASLYNAVSLASVEALVDFMRHFEARNG
ncbi:MAG TPA: 3-phosphoserine/phosphohydroxythreonine transaminase [Rubricoccaceae bacterium]|nr:3-phosphoserine/phosphohydroxythreonine transaminase [Rubricoccaceae bacterium]